MFKYELPHADVHAMHRLPVQGGLIRVLHCPFGGHLQNSHDAVLQHRVAHGEMDVVLTEGVLEKVPAENGLMEPCQDAPFGYVYRVGLKYLQLGLYPLKNL